MAYLLPIITVQPDFLQTVSDVQAGRIESENIWISVYRQDHPSVHAKVRVILDDVDRHLVLFVSDEVQVSVNNGVKSGASDATYSVGCNALDVKPTRIILPGKTYSNFQQRDPRYPQKIISFDVSPDGSQFSTGFHDGTVNIYPTKTTGTTQQNQKQLSKAHLSTVTSLRFFPSSRVLLTAGADFAIQILPADPASTPKDAKSPLRITSVRTLKGHTRAITGTAIISRGKNVLSCSKDGSLRLWDVGKGEQIKMLNAGGGTFVAVNAMTVGDRLSESTGCEETPLLDPREVDTADKIAYCALQDGSFEVFDLGSKRSVYRSPPGPSPLSAIAYLNPHGILATGSSTGLVCVYDVKKLGSGPTLKFSRNAANVEDLVFASFHRFTPEHDAWLVVATEDGLPFVASVDPQGPGVIAELAGVDCDAVRVVRSTEEGGQVWLAADDGIVRQY